MIDPDDHFRSLPVVNQKIMNWLIEKGVPMTAFGSSVHAPLKMQKGHCKKNRLFEPDNTKGEVCIAILIEDFYGPVDIAFWDARTGLIATHTGAGFAIGEQRTHDPSIGAMGGALRVYRTPLDWLKADRDGIVILNGQHAWSRLHHIARIEAQDDKLATHLRNALKPPRSPEVKVIDQKKSDQT